MLPGSLYKSVCRGSFRLSLFLHWYIRAVVPIDSEVIYYRRCFPVVATRIPSECAIAPAPGFGIFSGFGTFSAVGFPTHDHAETSVWRLQVFHLITIIATELLFVSANHSWIPFYCHDLLGCIVDLGLSLYTVPSDFTFQFQSMAMMRYDLCLWS